MGVLRMRMINDAVDKAGDADAADDEGDEKFLKKIEESMLTEMTLRGVDRIRRVFMRQPKRDVVDPKTGHLTMISEWVLDTEGVNLSAVMSIDHRVDHTRCTSNDIVEIITNLGVEAVRQALLGELRAVIEFDGSYVN